MIIEEEKLKELLIRPGHISEADFIDASRRANEKNEDIDSILINKGLIKDEQLGKLVAEYINVPFINIREEKINETAFKIVPEHTAAKKGVIAFGMDDEILKVGMLRPKDMEMINFLEKKTNLKVNSFLITKEALKNVLVKYKKNIKDDIFSGLEKLKDPKISNIEKDQINIKMLDLIIESAYNVSASDIHIEPYEDKIRIRFRIDGVLHEFAEIPKEHLDTILSRIKILSKMRTDEHLSSQDGKFKFMAGKSPVDIRVSVVPVSGGENIVMRLLAEKSGQLSLADLGFSRRDLTKLERAISIPHGMILVTGPTGSGKTTTIYEMLKILNTENVHVSSIEDPVEYNIDGISQIQVNEKANLTFATGLRAIVRQDPDIIMVGEIRDKETANIAINSAMTGHLVLSTLHANNAHSTLPRLIKMEIEPFLISSTVNIIIAQRLVRKLCEKCRLSYSITKEEIEIIKRYENIEKIFIEKGKKIESLMFFKGAGCKVCADTGYSGRVGIFELLEVSEEIKDLIIKKPSSNEILRVAKQNGMKTLLEDGIDKALNGVTSLSEVLRVTRE